MKLPKSTIIAIDIVLIVSGIAAVSLGLNIGFSALLGAIGTGLIATGGVNLLSHLLSERPQVYGAKMVASSRNTLDQSIHKRQDKAQKIELVGVSLSAFLRAIANEPNQTMANRVLRDDTRLRILFVHPNSQYLEQRAVEDNRNDVEDLRQLQRKSVEYCILFYKILTKKYEDAVRRNVLNKPNGSVQVKLTEFCPYITIERYDNYIYWGLYTSDTAGEYAPIFLTTREDNYVLYDKLKNHFVGLLNKNVENNTSSEDHFLIRMESGPPWLNRKLAKKILTEERLKEILNEEEEVSEKKEIDSTQDIRESKETSSTDI